MRHALATVLLLACSAAAGAADVCPPAAVHLVRHAEKAASGADPDVTLSDAGQRRAQALVSWFEGRPLHAIYATHLRRTQHTAAPLAAARDLDLRVLAAGDSERLQQRLASHHCGEHVLVVGHSNTVPAIAAALGAEDFAIGEDDYGDVFTVTPPARAVQRGRFGD